MRCQSANQLEKYLSNYNREAKKTSELAYFPSLTLECILGVTSEQIKGVCIFPLNDEEILYYSCQHYVVHNIQHGQYTAIRKEGSCGSVLMLNRFPFEGGKQVVVSLEKSEHTTYLGILEINELVSKGTNWRLTKLSNTFQGTYEDMTYHAKKGLLYILLTKPSQVKPEQWLWLYDLKRQLLVLKVEIRPSQVKSKINQICVGDQPSELYLIGPNYFRCWTINFNDKQLKQSNLRNVERLLKDKQIVGVVKSAAQLVIATNSELLFISSNQLIGQGRPPLRTIKQNKREDIEGSFESSLEQIAKMKYIFDEDCAEKGEDVFVEAYQTFSDEFYCVSQVWSHKKQELFAVSTKSGNVMVYQLGMGELRLMRKYNHELQHEMQYRISVSPSGSIILLTANGNQRVCLIQQYSQSDNELRMLWGAGDIDKEEVIAVSSPVLHKKMCTLGAAHTLKMFSLQQDEKKILFEMKMPTANCISVHPNGLILAVNYPQEIKLMAIEMDKFSEIISIKTANKTLSLRFTECGNYLVSNEANSLVFYNPFTLQIIGSIQPSELRASISHFVLGPLGQYVCYCCEDNTTYIQKAQFNAELNRFQQIQSIKSAHSQCEAYTCLHYSEIGGQSVFAGFTRSKYMVIYKNGGRDLVAQFPVRDCFVTDVCGSQNLMYVGTSKGTVRVYHWPIIEAQLELEIVDRESRKLRFKEPSYYQYCLQGSVPVKKVHKLRYCNRLVVTNAQNVITVITIEKRVDESVQRKKLMQIVNQIFFISKSESEKRTRLIQTSQGDILKVESEIGKERSMLERKCKEEERQTTKSNVEQTHLQMEQKQEYLGKIESQIGKLTEKLAFLEVQEIHQQNKEQRVCKSKIAYEKKRNLGVEEETQQLIVQHKQHIAEQILIHKENIKAVKLSLTSRVQQLQRQFQVFVTQQLPTLSQPQTQFLTQNDEKYIRKRSQKVEEIGVKNKELSALYQEYQERVQKAKLKDEQQQRSFQKTLEIYNAMRYTNLQLHTQVLKKRNELIERRQIISNKEKVVKMAYEERHKLQNYKQIIKGALSKLQDKKDVHLQYYFAKEGELSLIFKELIHQITQLEAQKRSHSVIEAHISNLAKQNQESARTLKGWVSKMKEVKRYLLLQGLNEDAEQKKMYVEQENLLTSINFYKKRIHMEFMKERKNTTLKKSALNLVIRQNKNLLQECNQLREETVNYEHEIRHLGRRLGEANQIITIEGKLSNQEQILASQSSQLNLIRTMFNTQIDALKIDEDA